VLQAVERTGSIKEAAAELDKSYRHVWARVKEAEQTFSRLWSILASVAPANAAVS